CGVRRGGCAFGGRTLPGRRRLHLHRGRRPDQGRAVRQHDCQGNARRGVRCGERVRSDSGERGVTGRLAGGKPALSLVVCTRDRAERLPALLDSLRGIRTERPWELVLVDSASSDATPEVLAALASGQTFGPLVEIATVREAEPGLARARNAGLA